MNSVDDLQEKLLQLEESERHYRALLDESADPTFSFYPDGTYRYVNQAFAQGVGLPVEKLIGSRIWDVFSKEEADKRFAVVQKVFNEGEMVEIEVRVPLPTGDTYYLTSAKPVFYSDGKVESVICTSKNITRRKLAEIALNEEHEKLQKALDEIKVLSGFLPICSNCKNVRDDKGYWSKIEQYLSDHSELELTHSLCPGCMKELYGDESWYEKIEPTVNTK